jgi:hypothetical protein
VDVNITWHIIWTVLFWHFMADFVFQKEVWKRNKSKSMKALSYHCLTYGFVMFVMMSFWSPLWIVINTLAHFLTDFFTSRWTAKLWREEKVNEFFIVIGLDQFIHFVTMFGTYIILNNAGSIMTAQQVIEKLGLN